MTELNQRIKDTKQDKQGKTKPGVLALDWEKHSENSQETPGKGLENLSIQEQQEDYYGRNNLDRTKYEFMQEIGINEENTTRKK